MRGLLQKKEKKIEQNFRELSVIGGPINIQTFLVGLSFPGETYLMLKFLSGIPNRDFYVFTKSPPEQYSDSKIKTKENGEELKPLNEHQNPILVFHAVFGTSSSKNVKQFFKRRGHNNLDIFYLSKSYSDLLKRNKRNNSNKRFLSKQTLKGIKKLYRDVEGYDMSYDDFKQLC